jgi:hypothetical protein
MTDVTKLGRRGFFRLTAALGLGGAVAGGLVRLSRGDAVAFIDPVVFPDAPVTVGLRFPNAPFGAKARLWLHIETPRGVVTRDLGRVRLDGPSGTARVAAHLAYPFEGRVPGTYRYTLEAVLGGRSAVSEAAVTYGVRDIRWFS